MNIRKPTDYVTMFTTLDTLMAAQLPQMELYCEIGRRTPEGRRSATQSILRRGASWRSMGSPATVTQRGSSPMPITRNAIS